MLDVESNVLSIWAPAITQASSLSAENLGVAATELSSTYVHDLHSLLDLPGSSDNLLTAAQVVRGYRSLKVAETRSAINLRQIRVNLMLGNCAFWRWFDCWVPTECHRLFQNSLQPSKDAWLHRLFVKACQMANLRTTTAQVFNLSDYAPHFPEASYCLDRKRKLPFYPDDEQREALAVEITQDVIAGWLGMPDFHEPHFKCRWQGWFVSALLEVFSPQTLYLDYVWRAHEKMTKGSLLKQHSRAPHYEKLESFKSALRAHRLSDPSSVECELVAHIANLIMADSTADARSLLGQSSKLHQKIFIPQVISNIKDKRLMVLANFMTQSLDVFYYQVDHPSISQHQRMMDYCLDCPGATMLQKAMIKDPDFLLPFREHAPCRLRSKAKGGPFDEDVLFTSEGLFSALLMRVVTFRTDFALLEPTFFNSIESWKETVSSMPNNYICNARAYGTHQPTRTVDVAQPLWEAARSCGWAKFVGDGDKNFGDLFTFFRRPVNKFPQLGDLTGFLLAGDYAYTRVAAKPDLQTIAQCMHTINRGANSGLEYLGYIERRSQAAGGSIKKPPLKVCVEGVKQVHSFLSSYLTPQQQKDVDFDYIMDENVLCKFARAVHLGLITL